MIGGLILTAAAVIAVIVLVARQRHVEKMERTRNVAAQIIEATERRFEGIAPLPAPVQASLREYGNEQHVEAARALGVPRVASRTDVEQLVERQALVRIETNPLYGLRRLQYSLPYVTPSAANLLDRIGHRFHEALDSAGLPPYRFLVTSVTRSTEDQKALQSTNANAASESSHEYGTTFDLHYEQFDFEGRPAVPDTSDIYQDELRRMLAEAYGELSSSYTPALKSILGHVLLRLQAEEDALVIYERRQPVFHVTAARPIPDTPPRLRARSPEGTSLVSVAP